MASPRKRKAANAIAAPSDLQDTFDGINDILIRIKPRLSDSRRTSPHGPLIDDLHKLAALGHTFTEKRPRSNKNWGDLADILDREGVHLWNTSGLIRQGDNADERQLFAALRLAAFRLIEAGLEQKPGLETLVHVLQLASKTGAILSDIDRHDMASSVLGCAAKYEEQLRENDDLSSEPGQIQLKARAVILYYSSRMQAAAREGNDAVAHFMLEKITSFVMRHNVLIIDEILLSNVFAETDKDYLSLLSANDREILAASVLDIGKAILKAASRPVDIQQDADGRKASEAIEWIQSAFAMVEKTENTATPGIADLKVAYKQLISDHMNDFFKHAILRSLARAYFLSSSFDRDNLVRAEATLQELLSSINGSNADHQQLRWMHLAVLKRQKASNSVLINALKLIVDNIKFNESNVTDVLQELKTFSDQHSLVMIILQHCLHRALSGSTADGRKFTDRFFISIILHAAKDPSHESGIKALEEACNNISAAEFELEEVPSTACVTLLWQCGDRQYHARKWSQAADWFLAGTHRIFNCISDTNRHKCLRKAALCYIEQREFAHASAIIRRCPEEHASTYYLRLLATAHQGLEEEAMRAIEGMVKASDFDRRMLLLATQLAHESDLKLLLLTVLEALLKNVRLNPMAETEAEAVVLIRCIVRLVLKLMRQPTADQCLLLRTLARHFSTAISLVENAITGKQSALIIKDVSWLWRTAYNTAVQGCFEWVDAEEDIANLFDSAYKLIQVYSKLIVTNADTELETHLVYSSFAALSARVFALRQRSDDAVVVDQGQIHALQTIELCKSAILSNIGKVNTEEQNDGADFNTFLHIATVFHVELLCARRDWGSVTEVIAEVNTGEEVIKTYEAIADLVWTQEGCPTQVLYTILETILHMSLDKKVLSLAKFSRWLRTICTILLSRNASADRAKALNYIEQAVNVMENSTGIAINGDTAYPMDERYWLLSTAYNTGVECLTANLLDEAKRWFESATIICRFVPDGQRHSEKISATYQRLLNRYTGDEDL